MKPHKHAEVIKAWAEGARIEERRYGEDEHGPGFFPWYEVSKPSWLEANEYRVKLVVHKWQAVIDAHAAGKQVQWRYATPVPLWTSANDWTVFSTTVIVPQGMWDLSDYEWRVAPDRVVRHTYISLDTAEAYSCRPELANTRFTFEDGVLVCAEVLK